MDSHAVFRDRRADFRRFLCFVASIRLLARIRCRTGMLAQRYRWFSQHRGSSIHGRSQTVFEKSIRIQYVACDVQQTFVVREHDDLDSR